MISLASACYGDSQVAKHFVPELGFPTNLGVGRSWLFPASSNQIPHQKEPGILVGLYLTPHEDKSIQLLSTVRCRKWKNNFMVHTKVHRLIE
jgi:hypothetical protein